MDAVALEKRVAEARRLASPERDIRMTVLADQIIREASATLTPDALNLLFEVRADRLPAQEFVLYTRWYGSWALDHQQMDLAQRLLDNDRLARDLPTVDEDTAIAVHRLRIRYLLQTEQPLRAVDEHLVLASLLVDPSQQQQEQNDFWQLLQRLSVDDRTALAKSGRKPLQAWLELLNIATAQELDLDEQVTHLENWLASYPRHPASLHLPAELQLLQSATRDRPQRITLLLPLSGNLQKAGEAIRDGFLAAYYQSLQRGYRVPEVTFADSQGSADFLALYDDIADSNTQMVIGPLEKEKVALLRQRGRLPVPTLALNDSSDAAEGTSDATARLFLFGLNPEDEARQIARQTREQHRRALIIAPNNDWGLRMQKSFTRDWLGTPTSSATEPEMNPHLVLGSALFDPKQEDYATVIQKALGIEESEQRLRRIRQWIGGDIEFEPRRRQDIDLIVLAARPEQARQIRPLLSFHYAGDIPVYASSSVYSGEVLPEKDSDLNGVQLLVSPWLLNANPLKNLLEKQGASQSALQNLHALGADAWRLHARLELLANNPQGRLHGNTGILQIEAGQRVTRQLFWARMEQGRLVSLANARPD